jgi:murein DD-endopeptidase MepM/ murein hydrolase activator NlpD
MKGRSWSALRSICYYPVDIEQPAGSSILVSRYAAGKTQYAHIEIQAYDYGTEDVMLPDIPQAHPSAADLRRDAQDRAKLARIFAQTGGIARFTLPLGPPATPLPPGKSFGVQRYYNGKPDSQPHMGVDYPTPLGSPVIAVAAGKVVLAEDMFFSGNSVFLNHGDGLISMYFHLANIDVKAGQEVQKGHILGRVGSTGRATGPHLFFGVRWRDGRINPQFVLENPNKIPSIQ